MPTQDRFLRLEKIKEIASTISPLFSFDYMYVDEQEWEWMECISEITGMDALAWNKRVARRTCYANVFSKLFLAWLIAEIREEEFLHLTYADLEKFKEWPLDTVNMFYFDDIGYQTATVIDILIEKVLERSKIIRYLTIPVEGFHPSGAGSEQSMVELLCDLKKVYPSIEKLIRVWPDIPICYLYDYGIADETELAFHVVESEILYKIWEMEKKTQTLLGQDIIAQTWIFPNMTVGDHFGLDGKAEFDDDKKIFHSVAYSSMMDLWGDGNSFDEPMYLYDFAFLLQFEELERKVERYFQVEQANGCLKGSGN